MESINIFAHIVFTIFTLCYFYQYVYIIVPWIGKLNIPKSDRKSRFAILVCARNEEAVIANCIDSILSVDYPRELVKVFVVADNCTDATAERAREAGAIVYERFNNEKIGKGYALEFLFGKINADYPDFADAFIIFDADNIVDAGFVSAMNDMLGAGFNVSTCYRNTKNYSDGIIAACSGLWFLRESKYLNQSRMMLRSGCAVSGTGFMISRGYLEKIGGWHYHILIEDIQFSVDCALRGERIGYCKDAIVYDEQPVSFITSWNQRMRWCKGYLQLLGRYGWQLIKKMFHGSFTCFDLFMNLSPAYILSIVAQFVFVIGLLVSFFTGRMHYLTVLNSCAGLLLGGYITFAIIGLITTITEWKQIHAAWYQKISTVFLFPVYMSTYLPITICSLFSRPQWKHIEHRSTKTKDDFVKRNVA